MEQNRVQRVRFADKTILFQTVTNDEIEYLYLADVQRRFPTVTAFSLNGVHLSFAANESNTSTEKSRIKAYPNEIIDAIAAETSSNSDVVFHNQLDRVEQKIDGLQITADRIDANTQEILTQMRKMMTLMYELHEYTTPRYFFILPAKHHDWTMIDTVQNWFHLHFKLYFLCECSDDPEELHIAPHDGYSIRKLNAFVKRYGVYLQKTLSVIQLLLPVGGFVLPQLAVASSTVGKAHSYNMKANIITIRSFLEKQESKLMINNSSLAQKQNNLLTTPLQGADLRQLESYLERIDSTRTLGNLHRLVTDDGHVRWVCQKHYDDISYTNQMTEYIKQLEAMGGNFNKINKEICLNQLKLTYANVKMISDALTKGLNITKLILHQCSIYETYFDTLIDIIINRSSIHCLNIIHLDILNFFGQSKYICHYIKIDLSNHLLTIHFNECYHDGNRNLLIRILTQNKIHRTLEISACDFLDNEQQLQECLNINGIITELIVVYANNSDILNAIFNSKMNQFERLKFNHSLGLSSVAIDFCDLLKKNQTLVELDLLDAVGFSDKDFIGKLFQTLKQHRSIKQLYLHICRIESSDEKETLLVDALENDKFITHLRLSFSVISTKLIQILSRTIKEHYSVVHLEFYHCNINEHDIEELQSLENDGSLRHLVISKDGLSCANIPINSKWKQNMINLIGDQLRYPSSLYIDDVNQTMYVADSGNHRILEVKYRETNGQIVRGNEQLDWPTSVIVDKQTDSLIICDCWNRQVVRWPRQNDQSSEVIISNIDCHSLIMDNERYLYVSDWKKHEVRRWKIGEKEGAIVAGGNGRGSQLNELDGPYHIYVDEDQSVYVSDYWNDRVVKWMKGAKQGIVVAGDQGSGDHLNQLSFPRGILVDRLGTLYIAEQGNHRVIRWLKGAKEGEVIINGNAPEYLFFDNENNLFVVDYFDHKISKCDLDFN